MHERLNKTLIGSVVFLDVIEYSRKPVSEQIACKGQLNRLIGDAVESIDGRDRIIVDAGDGVAIALLGSPEDALRIAVGIRERIAGIGQAPGGLPFHVRIGINLGPLQVVKDINGQFNVIGDGINVAHRVMGFAAPDQILVSRSYYEVASRLSKELEEMLAYSGLKQDKHVRAHEIYQVRPPLPGDAASRRPGKARWPLLLAGALLAAAGLIAALQPGKPPPRGQAPAATPASAPVPGGTAEPAASASAPARSAQAGAVRNEPGRPGTAASSRQSREAFDCTPAQRSLNQCR